MGWKGREGFWSGEVDEGQEEKNGGEGAGGNVHVLSVALSNNLM